MLTVAYLANQFPSAVEPYVGDEIEELRKRGVEVITGSVRKARSGTGNGDPAAIVLQSLGLGTLLRAIWLCLVRWKRVSGLVGRVLWRGKEGPLSRAKALLHTWLGACYAVMLANRGIDHIHVHHGYFGSWIAMTAARFLQVSFSMTLHGSDLLLHGAYLDVKLSQCVFCMTVSEYNRRHILEHYSEIDPDKVVVARLGVDLPERLSAIRMGDRLSLLAVGRLHAVKDHAFLIRACASLAERGVEFECSIAGDGPERGRLQALIRKCGVEDKVTLLGHVERSQMHSLYERADVVVLTSRSEGIPLVLMEAMALARIVLAPAITGIPELITAGKSGFLYKPGSLDDFVAQLNFINSSLHAESPRPTRGYKELLLAGQPLDWIRHAARVQVLHNFNRRKNLESFSGAFITRITPRPESGFHEDPVLQQVQLPV